MVVLRGRFLGDGTWRERVARVDHRRDAGVLHLRDDRPGVLLRPRQVEEEGLIRLRRDLVLLELGLQRVEQALVLTVGRVVVDDAVHPVLVLRGVVPRVLRLARAGLLADELSRQRGRLLRRRSFREDVGLVLVGDLLRHCQRARPEAEDAAVGELVGEHRRRLGGATQHGERLLLGDGDGVRLGGRGVGPGPRGEVELHRDLPAVLLEHLVVDVDVALPRLADRLEVEARSRGPDLPGEQRVLLRVAGVDDDLDLVPRHALRGRPAVLPRERLDARRRVDRRDLHPPDRRVTVRAEVDVGLALELRLQRRHRAGQDERLVLLRVRFVARRRSCRRCGEQSRDDHHRDDDSEQ